MRALVSIALASLCLIGCASKADPGAVDIDPPLPTSSASPVVIASGSPGGGSCTAHRVGGAAPQHGKVSVDPSPSSVTAIWWPGLISRTCRTVTTHASAALAKELAGDVRSAPALPRGPIACPASLGVAVDLYFAVGAKLEFVDVLLTGCPSISAPGRTGRAMSPELAADLVALAPRAWQRYLPER